MGFPLRLTVGYAIVFTDFYQLPVIAAEGLIFSVIFKNCKHGLPPSKKNFFVIFEKKKFKHF